MDLYKTQLKGRFLSYLACEEATPTSHKFCALELSSSLIILPGIH
jgi:hypothetical protein